MNKFLDEEKALAIVSPGRGDMGTFNVQGGGTWKKGDPQGLPSLSMEPEHFGRVARLLDRSVPVEIEMDVQAHFIEEDLMQWNTIAEIPGGDKKDEVVMVGAHLDSWHGATGATDNGAGSVVAMEAMRILKAVGVKPRRTIRIGLWSGEEQALYGSRAYVSQHFASRPEPSPEEKEKPFYLRKKTGPLTVKPEHAKLSVYFNLDNGSGKIRGIYCEDNAAVAPIFRDWLAPFADLGATLVTLNRTGGTDHESFDEVGLPGFQFVQDELEYETRTHHTNMDLYERLQKNDLMQASVIMAAFAYNAAMRDGMIPSKPMPKDEPAKGEPAKAGRRAGETGLANRRKPRPTTDGPGRPVPPDSTPGRGRRIVGSRLSGHATHPAVGPLFRRHGRSPSPGRPPISGHPRVSAGAPPAHLARSDENPAGGRVAPRGRRLRLREGGGLRARLHHGRAADPQPPHRRESADAVAGGDRGGVPHRPRGREMARILQRYGGQLEGGFLIEEGRGKACGPARAASSSRSFRRTGRGSSASWASIWSAAPFHTGRSFRPSTPESNEAPRSRRSSAAGAWPRPPALMRPARLQRARTSG